MQPRSREERHMFKHKETLERERLKNRTGNYFRYEEIKDPLAQEETGPAYIREKDRLTAGGVVLTDKFAEERQLAEDRRNQNTEVHRREHVQREEDRWNAEDAKERSSQDRAKRMIEDPLIGKKNVSAVPYNIVSLNYHDSYEGRKLKHNDDMTRYRGELRKVNLAHKAHLGYNCILGEQAYKINAPQKPDAFNEEPPKGYQVEFGQVQ